MRRNSNMSAKDLIKESVIAAFSRGGQQETVLSLFVSLLVSLIIGVAICMIYNRLFIYREGILSNTFGKTLIGMTVLTCMVTLAISTNIVISLGMVGSLSIVRYRTAVKDPMDLLYLFWAITSGITIGAGMNALCMVGFVVVSGYLLIANKLPQVKHDYVLVLRCNKKEYNEKDVKSVLSGYKYALKTQITHGDILESTFSIRRIERTQLDFLNEKLTALSGIQDIAIINYNGDYNE